MFLWTGPGFDVTSFETYSRHTRPIKYIITTSQMLFVGFWPTCMEMVWPHVLLFNNTNGFANAKCKNNKAYYLIVIHLIGDISYFVSLTLSPNTVNGSFPARDTYSLWGCVRRVKSNTWSCPLWRPLLKVVVALSFLLCAFLTSNQFEHVGVHIVHVEKHGDEREKQNICKDHERKAWRWRFWPFVFTRIFINTSICTSERTTCVCLSSEVIIITIVLSWLYFQVTLFLVHFHSTIN